MSMCATWTETVTIHYARCERCGHEWKRRSSGVPKVCPKCKSPYWNKERTRSEGKAEVTSKRERYEKLSSRRERT